MKPLNLALLVAFAAFAGNEPPKGEISGVVLEASSGKPAVNVIISCDRSTPEKAKTLTDASGRFAFRNLKAGAHQIQFFPPNDGDRLVGLYGEKLVTLGEGEKLSSLTFRMRQYGEITGRVLNDHKEPMPGIGVYLIGREYSHGALRHVMVFHARTDDQGEYRLRNVIPGRGYFILATKEQMGFPPVSDLPAEPELRKRAFAPTFYPNGFAVTEAQPIGLRDGEKRSAMDIRLRRTPSYCVEGVAESPSGPTKGTLSFGSRQVTTGMAGGIGLFGGDPSTLTGPDGKFRICDVAPGEYLMTMQETNHQDMQIPAFFGRSEVTVVDRDVKNLRVVAGPLVPLTVQVALDGKAPEKPFSEKIRVQASRPGRPYWRAELVDSQVSIPGEMQYPSLLMDDYEIAVAGIPPNLYVKDITYGGISVPHGRIRPGAAGSEIAARVILGQDGAILHAKVSDKDGNAVPDAHVHLLPVEVNALEEVADSLISGLTDQRGVYESRTIRPGKYYAFATTSEVDKSPESIGAIWNARSHAKEVTLGTDTDVVTLEPRSLE